MKLVWYNHLKINEVIDDKLLLPNHSTVVDYLGNNKPLPYHHINCSFKIILKSVHLSFVRHYSTKQEKLFNLIKELKEVDKDTEG
ncbi:MAG: hypothetical protein CMG00_06420 [Candidatus Marinimicrobia bacterium]|nr:hypothetical protein [Candidatus Neomarinimicrobiota bacterium]